MELKKDIFRKSYIPLDGRCIEIMSCIKEKAQSLYDEIENCSVENDKRHMALAKTKLEESVMWAIKGITG